MSPLFISFYVLFALVVLELVYYWRKKRAASPAGGSSFSRFSILVGVIFLLTVGGSVFFAIRGNPFTRVADETSALATPTSSPAHTTTPTQIPSEAQPISPAVSLPASRSRTADQMSSPTPRVGQSATSTPRQKQTPGTLPATGGGDTGTIIQPKLPTAGFSLPAIILTLSGLALAAFGLFL